MATLVIAHRGNSSERPENTLSAFTNALELGVQLVELDIQLTSDGHPVVLHDFTLDRTTSGHGPVGEHTLEQVRALSAGYARRFGSSYAGERVPTLPEVLGLFRGRARALIEIKGESVTGNEVGGIEALAIAAVRKAGMTDEVAFLSFERRALTRCRAQAPEIVRGHLFARGSLDEVLEGARQTASEFVMPEKGMLSEALRDGTQAEGLRLGTWVVDDPLELAALARYELFGVASNRPAALMEALEERAAGLRGDRHPVPE